MTIAVQPIVDLSTGATAGWEALARWEHRLWGPIPPRTFIGAAERFGCIDLIDSWVLQHACKWRARGRHAGFIGVNVSAGGLDDPGFAARVLGVVRSHGLRPSDLFIEITETVAMRRGGATTGVLHVLSDAGVYIALDDLGQGHATLKAISDLPVDVVKLDRSIAGGIGRGLGAERYAQVVAASCHLRGRRIVAEGIETAEQARFFRDLGCTWGRARAFTLGDRLHRRMFCPPPSAI
jgi:EAL domain-containing protein (putative c-di-GMP-specific phosphodiesterase class I)